MSNTILITGCSSGLGHHAAKGLAAAGHHVYATMRNVKGRNADVAEGLREWAAEHGHTVEVVELDVTSDESVTAAFADLPPLDVLINNAGVGFIGAAESFTPDQFARQLDVNLVGAFRVTRAALPGMRKQGSGLILQVSSISGRAALVGDALYTSSKWGLEGLSEGMRYELGPLGIDVVLLEPGPFITDFGPNIQGADTSLGDAYAHVAGFQQGFLEMHASMAQDPKLVTDTFLEVMATAPGERPLRIIPGMDFGMNALNEAAEAVRQGMAQEMGIADWDGAKGG